MKRTSLLAVLAVVAGAALAAGCVARPDVTPGAPPPTPVVRIGSETEEQGEDDAAVELASRFPLAASEADTADGELDDSECIDCHTDQEAVQALAEEPEEEEELSEGEG